MDYPRQVEGLEIDAAEGGCKVTLPDQTRIHHLNASASAVLLLCDGRNSVDDIANVLNESYGLDEAPVRDVEEIISEFRDAGLVRQS